MSSLAQPDHAIDEAEALLEQTVSSFPSRADVDRVDRRSSRRMTVAVAICMLISILSLTFGGYAISRAAAAEASLQLAKDAEAAYTIAKADLQRSGVPEEDIPNPDPSQVDTSGIIKAASAAVLAAMKDDPAYRGPAGPPGAEGQKGDRGERGPRGETCPGEASLRSVVVRNGDNEDITIIACME